MDDYISTLKNKLSSASLKKLGPTKSMSYNQTSIQEICLNYPIMNNWREKKNPEKVMETFPKAPGVVDHTNEGGHT